MKYYSLMLIILILTAGCQSAAATPTPAAAPSQPAPTADAGQNPSPAPLTPTTLPDAYPYPPPVEPLLTPTIGDYPAPAEIPPTVNPYPSGESVWIIQSVGKQCEDAKSYEDLQTAVNALGAAGITVQSAELTNLVVCTACGCPTSAHYRLQIDSAGLAAAVSLGWEAEPQGN